MRAIVFDLGHTIIDFGPAEQALHDTYLRVLDMLRDVALTGVSSGQRPGAREMVEGVTRRIFDEIEASYAREELEELDILQMFDGALRRLGFHLDAALIREIAVLEHRALASDEIVPPENVAIIHSLKRAGYKIGLVSNVTLLPDMMREDLEQRGLLPSFDVTVFSSEEKIRKPHPRIYQAALTRLGVPAADAVFVGDRLKEDVRGPKEAGMRAVLTTQFRREDPRDAVVQPDAVIDSLAALPAVLETLQ